MNVLFIVQPDFLVSHVGVRRVILHYLAALKHEGHQVRLAALKDRRLQGLIYNPAAGGPQALQWTDRPVPTGEFSTVVVTNPWLCADGLPDLPGCIGIVYDMIPNLIATGCLRFSNPAGIFGFAHAHDVGYRYYLRNARRICCISESTRQDFLELYGPVGPGTEVVAHVPFEVKEATAAESAGTRVLLVNALDARKNLAGIADVLEQVQRKTPIHLDIVGRARSAPVLIENFFARLKRAGIRHDLHQDVSNEKLQLLYQGGAVLLFPSLYEGLGLPVLEAQQEGIPAITTNNSSLPEINLNPSLCFQIEDTAGMAEALVGVVSGQRKVLRGEPLRAALAALMAKQTSVTGIFGLDALPAPMVTANSPTVPPPFPVPEPPVAVAWEGSFLDYGSLSVVNRALSESVGKCSGVALSRVGRSAGSGSETMSPAIRALAKQLQPRTPSDAWITVRHQWPPDWSRPKQGALVVMQPWEFGTLPADWVRQASGVDEFWAYTNYVRQVYVSSGVDSAKVKVVPLGIDPAVFRPDVPAHPLATTKQFKFLFVGGTITRKGPDVLLAAYLANFTAADDVCLVIKDFGGKTVYAGQTLEAQIKAAQVRPDAPEILYLNEELAPEALPALYAACDSLVHPYRGEGFGLPVLEAMACGLPVIVTAGGSTDDFAPDEFAYRIPAVRKSIGPSISGMKLAGDGWLLEPDVNRLGERMKWVVAHRDEARILGRRASVHARSRWTWDHAATVAAGRLHAIADRPGRQTAAQNKPAARKAAASTLPAVARIGDLSEARDLLRRKSPRAAWDRAREAIRARPCHPEAFLLLAEIARKVGASSGALSCARHALKLSPAFKPAKKFLQEGCQGHTSPDWLILPPEIANSKTKPNPRLSVCLIVKNEERFLGQCLRSIKDVADQIVVVDTGSTDRTVAIAQEFGAEIHAFAWCDDFSAARNAALQHASGDWVLSLDADEELPPENHAALRRLLDHDSVLGWRLPLIDVGREQDGHSHVPRLFRNAPGLFFVGRVHEQVFYSVEARCREWGLENRIGDAALRHHGYTRELVKERGKVERNLRLLEQAVNEIPDDPALFMNYGLELVRSNRMEEGLRQYATAFAMMAARPTSAAIPETREALLTQYTTYLRAANRPGEVLSILSSPLARSSEPTASQHFVLGLAHMDLKQFSAAAQEMRSCLAKRTQSVLTPVTPDVRTVLPRHFLAVCLWQTKETEAADQEFRTGIVEAPEAAKLHIDYANFLHEQGQTVEALQLLNQFTTNYPAAVAAWTAGGRITLSEPKLLEVAVDWTAVALNHHPADATVLAQRAEALMLAGQLHGALSLWGRSDVDANPRVLAARILCQAALGAGAERPPVAVAAAVNQEFGRWYWRLVEFGAEPTVLQLHATVATVEQVLPDSARLLHSICEKLAVTEPA